MHFFRFEKLPLQDHKPFFKAVKSRNLVEVRRLFRNYEVDVNAVSSSGQTALSFACANLDAEMITFLLDLGADINKTYPHWVTTKTMALDEVVFIWKKAGREKDEERQQQAAHVIELLWTYQPTWVHESLEEQQPQAHLHCFCDANSKALFRGLISYWKAKTPNRFIKVDLSSRDINDFDLSNLAEVLQVAEFNRYITSLDLSNNSFSHSGLHDLAAALEKNKTLQSLNLSNNTTIGCRSHFYSGFQYLIRFVSENKELQYLNVKGCPLDKADINTLLYFLKNKPQDSKLERIDFDISAEVLASLPAADQNVIRTAQSSAYFVGVIMQCKNKLMSYRPNDERTAALLKKSLEFLNGCKEDFSGEDISLYLEGISAGLMKFIDVALENNFIELVRRFDEVLKILELSRTSNVLRIITAYNTKDENSIDAFCSTFENNMHALCISSWGIYSRHIKSQIVTPAEKMIKIAKNLILGLSGFSKVIEANSQLLEFAGESLKTVGLHGAELMGKTKEAAELIMHIPCGDDIKDFIIRKIHGATIRDACEHLVKCFRNFKTALSKTTAMSHAIFHYYQDSMNNLPPEKVAIMAKYAFLHISDLLMSGLISKKLTAEALIEEVITYLSYVPIRDTVIRDDLLTAAEKQEAQAFFMQPGLKFSSKGKRGDCYCTVNDQNPRHPKRWATPTEMTALNELLAKRKADKEFKEDSATTFTLISHPLKFNEQNLLFLEKKAPFETELTDYKSQSKRMKSQGEEIIELRRQVNFLMQNVLPKKVKLVEEVNQVEVEQPLQYVSLI